MCNLRCRIRKALRISKNIKSIDLLGCTIKFYKNWLEYQFKSNMSWKKLRNLLGNRSCYSMFFV